MKFAIKNLLRTVLTPRVLIGVLSVAAIGAVPAVARADRREDDRGRSQQRNRDGRHDRDDHRDRDHDSDRDHSSIRLNLHFGSRPQYERVPAYQERVTNVWVEPAYRTVSDRRWVQPEYRTVTERVWVPDQFEWRDVSYTGEGRVEIRREQVLVASAHYENVSRQELICEGHWEIRDRQELVSPGHWERRIERVRVG